MKTLSRMAEQLTHENIIQNGRTTYYKFLTVKSYCKYKCLLLRRLSRISFLALYNYFDKIALLLEPIRIDIYYTYTISNAIALRCFECFPYEQGPHFVLFRQCTYFVCSANWKYPALYNTRTFTPFCEEKSVLRQFIRKTIYNWNEPK
jgi:hypothetical protein